MPNVNDRVLEVPVQLTDRAEELPREVELTPGPAFDPDRRTNSRLPLGLWAHCQIDGVVSQEALGDLSQGGLFLRTQYPGRIGVRVRIVLGLPYIGGQRVCSLSGRVVWIEKTPTGTQVGLGVQFDHETDSADHQLLHGFLALWGLPRDAAKA